MNIRVTVGSDLKYSVKWPNTLVSRILQRFIKVEARHISALGECAYIEMRQVNE